MGRIVKIYRYLLRYRLVHYLRELVIRLILAVARRMPLKRKIVFNSFAGKGFCDEPKYIFLEMERQGFEAEFIWLVNDLSAEMPPQIKKVRYCSWRAVYHYLTAMVWIDNAKFSPKPRKRPGQFYLQTWHGIWAVKGVEQAVEKQLNPEYVAVAKRDASITDLMFCNNTHNRNLFQNSFWYDGPVIDCGDPNFAALIRPRAGLGDAIRRHFGVPAGNKILLYAPTFRKNFELDAYKWDYDRVMRACEEKFGGKFTMLLRLHPNIESKCSQLAYSGNVIQASSYPDIYELLSASDILITDFSSTMAFMGFIRKPVFLFAADFDDYFANDRDTAYPLDKLPFPTARSESELCAAISAFDSAGYGEKLDAFYHDIGMVDDGCGAVKLCRIIEHHMRMVANG